MKYVSAKEAKKYFQISGQTLKVWKDTNKILTKQFSQKKILYDIDSVNNDNNITNFNSEYFSYKWIQILNLFAIDLANRYESIEVIKTSKKAKERIRHDIYDMEYLLFALAEGNFATKEDKLIRWFKLLSKDGTCITNKI